MSDFVEKWNGILDEENLRKKSKKDIRLKAILDKHLPVTPPNKIYLHTVSTGRTCWSEEQLSPEDICYSRDEWLPIESAPLNGQFLAYFPNSGYIHIIEKISRQEWIDIDSTTKKLVEKFELTLFGTAIRPSNMPTLWRPFPDPPGVTV